MFTAVKSDPHAYVAVRRRSVLYQGTGESDDLSVGAGGWGGAGFALLELSVRPLCVRVVLLFRVGRGVSE